MDPKRVTMSVRAKINKGRWFEADGGDNEIGMESDAVDEKRKRRIQGREEGKVREGR